MSDVVIVDVAVDVIFNSSLPKVGRIVRHYEKRKKKKKWRSVMNKVSSQVFSLKGAAAFSYVLVSMDPPSFYSLNIGEHLKVFANF